VGAVALDEAVDLEGGGHAASVGARTGRSRPGGA
jgi:hypothetical protein